MQCFGRLARHPNRAQEICYVQARARAARCRAAQCGAGRSRGAVTCGFHTIVAQRGPVCLYSYKGPLTKTLLKRPPQQLLGRNNCVEFASNEVDPPVKEPAEDEEEAAPAEEGEVPPELRTWPGFNTTVQ